MSSNALGNLNMLASDIGSGVKDFFYLPRDGFVKGPLEGTKGIVQGTGSLLKNTAKGTFGSVSRLTENLSNGILLFADDSDYSSKRKAQEIKPTTAVQGITQGLKSTGMGLQSGIQGLYQLPLKGGREKGVQGFLKGSALGLSGAIVKPVSGALDFLHKTAEGIKNQVSHKEVEKVRSQS